jgi:hypothetical protein
MEDSAMYYLSKSMQASKALKDTVWQGINALSIGQILFNRGEYEAAKTNLYVAYNTNNPWKPALLPAPCRG